MKKYNENLSCSLPFLFGSILKNREIIIKMTKREILLKYRGSIAGLLWTIVNPILMLLIYTFVFSVIFKAKWGVEEESKAQFAIVLFAGLIVYSIFSEVINKAPQLILGNVNYVKKVVFPLEILPVVQVLVSLFNALLSILILVLFNLIFGGKFYWTIIFLPFVLLPFIMQVLGFAWFLTSLGVFLRDVSHFVALVTSGMLFLSPVFFPLKAVPEFIQGIMKINPLTFIIEEVRNVVIFGVQPNWEYFFIYIIISFFVMWSGFLWFQKTRKGFADVL